MKFSDVCAIGLSFKNKPDVVKRFNQNKYIWSPDKPVLEDIEDIPRQNCDCVYEFHLLDNSMLYEYNHYRFVDKKHVHTIFYIDKSNTIKFEDHGLDEEDPFMYW